MNGLLRGERATDRHASRGCSSQSSFVGALQHYLRARQARLYLRAAAALLLLAALASGCRAFVAEPAYQPTPLPADVTELYRVFGDAGADTVWIYEQGGPVHMLDDDPLVSRH